VPKSGKVAQWCPCGSNLRPHIALSIKARSLHVVPREDAENITIYVCEICVKQFQDAITHRRVFSDAIGAAIRDKILGAVAASLDVMWEAIAERVPT